jgi:thiamine-phosphate pyrophosphorylase
MRKIPRIQYITRDEQHYTHAEQARLAFKAGVKLVQLRMKNSSRAEITNQARLALSYAHAAEGQLIINDYLDIALAVNADGIHLGLKDMPVEETRREVKDAFIIGATANTFEEVLSQAQKGADYVGVGPFRHTTTKKNLSPILEMDGYRTIMKQLQVQGENVPLVAVGGITESDINGLLELGIHGVAISGAFFKQVIETNRSLDFEI